MTKPRCSICDEAGVKYTTTLRFSTTTAIGVPPPYWDEEGNYHVPPDPNHTVNHYTCSNGHNWTELHQ